MYGESTENGQVIRSFPKDFISRQRLESYPILNTSNLAFSLKELRKLCLEVVQTNKLAKEKNRWG